MIYRGPAPYIDHIQNTDVEGKLTLLLRNMEDPGSLPQTEIVWIYLVHPGRCRNITHGYAATAPFHILPD